MAAFDLPANVGHGIGLFFERRDLMFFRRAGGRQSLDWTAPTGDSCLNTAPATLPRTKESDQLLVNALKKYSGKILPLLQKRKHQLMEETDSAKFRIGLWLALAVDGSRLDTPRTQANERQFCKQQHKKNLFINSTGADPADLLRGHGPENLSRDRLLWRADGFSHRSVLWS